MERLAKIKLNPLIIIFILTVVSFWILTKGFIILPSNIEWLMEGETDSATYWIGWEFFRHTPLLQWPIGANPYYGLDISSSVVFSDSLPLFAFLFKLLNPILPKTFQYFGLWIFLCFFLQLFFAWKILLQLTRDQYFSVLCSLFFVFAPLFLNPLHGHYGLLGHWVLLAGLYFYFRKDFIGYGWLGLLGATVLIHGYLFVMVAALWLTDLTQVYFKKQLTKKKLVLHFVLVIIGVLLIMWAAGYFMVGKGSEAQGFGTFRLNLASLFIPQESKWSILIPSHKYISFAYLGTGFTGLCFISICLLVKNSGISINKSVFLPLLVLSLLLTVYAISTQVMIGSYELFSYTPPAFLKKIIKTFRVSYRLFWPVYYLIYFGVFYILYKYLKKNIAIICCALFLVTQGVDSANAITFFNQKFTHWAKWDSPMQAGLWEEMAQKYKKINYVIPGNQPPFWAGLTYFAATHKIPINIAYYARIKSKKLNKSRQKLLMDVLRGDLNSDTLYVFNDERLWRVVAAKAGKDDVIGELDGFKIIAPKLKACANCNVNSIKTYQDNQSDFDYNMQPLSFSHGGKGLQYVLFGIKKMETWGAWTTGERTALLLKLPEKEDKALELLITGRSYLARKKPPHQLVKVFVNGLQAGTLVYHISDAWKTKSIHIPKDNVMPDGYLLIEFEADNPVSPAEQGLGDDGRLLGFGLTSLSVIEQKL